MTDSDLARENAELRSRVEEAEDALRALRAGEVDAVIVHADTDRVYTLDTADKPYRLLVERMPQAAATLTSDGTILYCNPRFAEVLGRPHGDLVGHSLLDHADARSRSDLVSALTDARAEEVRREIVLRRPDGEPASLYLGVTGLEEGALGLCILVTDLTQQRHYLELQRTQAALRDADRRKDEFLATLAHELRNPLAPIRSAVELLRVGDPARAEFRWARDVIDRQTQHMARLLEDLLDVSRISSNKLELRRERVELATVIDAAVETSRPAIDRCRHELHVELPETPVWLDADPVRLAQVFANLLNNAAKYMEDGGLIRLSARTQGADVLVSVHDRGIGITADMLPRLFTIFSQAQPAIARSQGGLGIGLSLVKGLVELHGGHIEARSEGVNRGSEFVVTLPVAGPSGRRSTAVHETPAGHWNIVVADDNQDTARGLALLLESMGHHAVPAFGGEEAVALATSLRPDVVLLDIGMPGVNGYDVCRQIRSLPWGAEVIVVATTGWGQDEDRRRSGTAGFDLHVVKPLDAQRLVERIDRCMRARPTAAG